MMPSMLLFFGLAFLQEEGEVLDRGAIHEAYAQPVLIRPAPGPVLDRKPPDPLREVPPEEKPEGENVRWIAGYWRLDEDRNDFVWVSGFWRQIPPGMEWISGRFIQAEKGWRWYPGYWKPLAVGLEDPVEDAPPPIPEIGPSVPAPQPDMTWSQGYWDWRGGGYAWRPGLWRAHRPGWVWTPTCWTYTPSGYVRLPGYWDYALEYRGFLFSTVYYSRPMYQRPGFYHRPQWVIRTNDLPGGLFVRSGCGNYFYGDYFRPTFANQGFQFWTNLGRANRPDPIFDYYRMERQDLWAQSVRQYGRDRISGKPGAPPTFVPVPNPTRTPGAPVANVPPMGVGQIGKWVSQLPKKPPSLVSGHKPPPKHIVKDPSNPRTPPKPKTPEAAPPKPKTPEVAPPKPKTPEVAPPKPKTPEAAPPKPKTPEAAPPKPRTPEVAPPKPRTPEVAPSKPRTPEVAPPKPKTPEVAPPKPKTR